MTISSDIANAEPASRPDGALPRLLRHLAQDGADARPDPLSPTRLLLVKPRRGAAQPQGTLPIAIARAAIEADLACWLGSPTGVRRLALTAEGRAWLARHDADDGIEPFQAQHGDIVRRVESLEGERRAIVRNEAESPLEWLRNRRGKDGRPLLCAASFEAGERLRRDLTLAAMLPSVTTNWSAVGDSGGRGGARPDAMSVTDTMLAARQRVRRALEAVGTDLAGLLVDVCGFLVSLVEVETERGWPRRSAKVVLDLALKSLAVHYGLATEARGPSRARAIRHWGTEDFRPAL